MIKKLAREEAKKIGKTLTSNAETRISEVPKPYNLRAIDVRLENLRFMLRSIVVIAAPFGSNDIGVGDVERALAKVKCHYLWFC